MTELDEIKLLLKDQVEARKQQFDAFQEQMAALQAELQATKGLIQAGSYGCGGETASPIPCSMRFDVPKFSGTDPDRWIFSTTEYFTLLSTPFDQRLRVYEDPQGAFSELLQKGTVAQYQGEFEKLMYHVTDVSDGLLISFYISRLKPTLQRILLVSKPTSQGLLSISKKKPFFELRFMASDGSDQDARYALSKLLQRGMVAEYESEFLMLIKRVTGISDSLLKSFYISGLKPALQCLLLRSNPKTLDETFSLARAAETRFANLDIWEFLRSNPSTLGEDFFKSRITEARFEIIAKEVKEHIVEKKIDVILPLQGEFASPKAEGSLNADEYTGVEEVVDGGEALGIGEDNDLGDAATDGGDDVVKR
nr:hypothetical protein [Tanacetum cinerariifolium]